MSSIWEGAIAAVPALERWVSGSLSDLEVGRLPRPAWPIVAGAVARAVVTNLVDRLTTAYGTRP